MTGRMDRMVQAKTVGAVLLTFGKRYCID